jgi:hypothetical protein
MNLPNPAASMDAPMAFLSANLRQQRRVSEQHRSAAVHSISTKHDYI